MLSGKGKPTITDDARFLHGDQLSSQPLLTEKTKGIYGFR
jgi:hypothetical protein